MTIDITDAKNAADKMHKYMSEIAGDVVGKYSAPLDAIVKKLSSNVETCSNEELRSTMISLGIETYNLAMHKENSELKDACANALYKESVATSFNSTAGTVESRKNQSIIDSMNSQAVSILYSSVSSILRTKLDEAHRLANIISGILISRASDAKLTYNPRSEENPFDKDSYPYVAKIQDTGM